MAWALVLPSDGPRYRFVDDAVPELALWVRSSARREGLGRRLLRGLQDESASRGLPGLSLSVEDGNHARHLYESEGFVDVPGQLILNAWRLRAKAGPHDGVLLWNMVPWHLGAASVKPTAYDLARGATALRGLLDLLPDLQVVVLAGLAAQRGWTTHLSCYHQRDLTVIPTWHFSNQAMNQPGKREELLASLRKAKALTA